MIGLLCGLSTSPTSKASKGNLQMIYQPYPFKQCVTCKKPLPFRAFHRNRTMRDGLQKMCKACNLSYLRAHKEKRTEIARRYRQTHRDKYNAHVRQYRLNHPEAVRKANRNWYATHRAKAIEAGKLFAKTHPGFMREQNKKYRQRHPEKTKQIRNNQSARRRGAEGKCTSPDMRAQYAKQNGLCYWCSVPLPDNWHADHVIPISRGGTNWPENMVCACPSCNYSKSDRLPYDEWQPPNPLFPRRGEG